MQRLSYFIGVVFVRSNEHHWTFVGWNLRTEVPRVLKIGGDPQPKNVNDLVDGIRRTTATEQHIVVFASTDTVSDDTARLPCGRGVTKQMQVTARDALM